MPSKRTTGKKSGTTRAKSGTKAASKAAPKSTNKPKTWKPDRTIILLMIILGWVLGIVALFSLGQVGRFLHELLDLFIGCFQWVLIPALMYWGFFEITRTRNQTIDRFILPGFFFIMLAWTMTCGMPLASAADPWKGVAFINVRLPEIILGTFSSISGWLGAVLAGTFTILFSRAGAWLFTAAFWLIGFGMIFHRQIVLLWLQIREKQAQPKEEPEEEPQPALQQEETEKPSFLSKIKTMVPGKNSEADTGTSPTPADLPKPDPIGVSIFNGGILADDVEEEPSLLQHVYEPIDDFELMSVQPEEVQPQEEEKPKKLRRAARRPKKEEPQPDQTGPENDMTVYPAERLEEEDGYDDWSKYRLPPVSLLESPSGKNKSSANVKAARDDGEKLIRILNDFGVEAKLGEVHIGPSVTKFEVIPGQGVRVNAFTNLQNDIKMALAATDIRVEAPIPGKSAVGIEIPNVEKTTVSMKELVSKIPPSMSGLPLVFGLGKDLMGNNVYGRLDTMPHLLIAGATGSGKSVCVNSIICSILMRTRPDEVKLLLIDPKKVEFTPYNGVPHLMSPVITDGELAGKSLKVIVAMMDKRYSLFEEAMVRNISSYNAWVDQNPDAGHSRLPRIVVVIDELADLMISAPKEVEQSIQRITQLARAAGIHLIVATQRPSVNVITGVIKANIPSRIAFAVSSSTDSRTILDQSGAERLLGYGDMLFLDNGDTSVRRIQGVFIKDQEVNAISAYAAGQGKPRYDDAFITLKEIASEPGEMTGENADPLYNDVKQFVIATKKASTSLIQRRFAIGYGRAARIIDMLETNGIVGPSRGSRPREILAAGSECDDLEDAA